MTYLRRLDQITVTVVTLCVLILSYATFDACIEVKTVALVCNIYTTACWMIIKLRGLFLAASWLNHQVVEPLQNLVV